MEGEGQDYGGEVDLDYGICHTLHMIKKRRSRNYYFAFDMFKMLLN